MYHQFQNVSKSMKLLLLLLTISGMFVALNLTSQEHTISALSWTVDKIGLQEQNPRSKLKLEFTVENKTFRRNLLTLVDSKTYPSYVESADKNIIPPSARVTAKKIFHNKPLVVWATEMHMTPMKDLANTLEPFGVKLLDYSLDISRCGLHNCSRAAKLKVLNAHHVKDLTPPVAESFVKAYKDDPEMKAVDVVFCAHPAFLCQIYLPLNKSVIVLPSTRYDMFRFTTERWNGMNDIFRKMAEKPWNVFGGNNLYDAKFLQYYTGIPVQHIPSMCDYTNAQYTMDTRTFIILRRYDVSGFNTIFMNNFTSSCKEINCTVKLNFLAGFSYRNLASYRAVVNIPYQVSVMTLFELYRMNVPMFFPSAELLARWQVEYFIMSGRTHDSTYFGIRPNTSKISPHPSQAGVPDPKNEYDYESILYWVRMADFYQIMPHGIIFNSIPHLAYLLENVDDNLLRNLSKKMETYNVEFKKALLNKWRDILLQLAKNSPNHPH